MSRPNFIDLGDLTAISVGDAKDVSHLEEWSAMVGGTFVGTVSIEVSFDGALWVPHPDMTGKTAPFVQAGALRVKQIRANCTAFTSGTLECRASGSDQGA